MRIAHVVASLPYGGMQRLVAQVAEEQLGRGGQPHVIALYEDENFASDLARRRVPFSLTPGTRPSVNGVVALRRHLRKLKPDLVHFHGGLLWPRATGLFFKEQPWVQHVHSYPNTNTGVKGWMAQCLDAHLCDAYIGISESVSNAVRVSLAGRGKRVYTIHNGVPTNLALVDFPPGETNAPVYGMATRLASDKGVWEFLEVAREIRKLQPGARFVLAGDGPLKQELGKCIREERWGRQFSLPGHVVDVEAFWRRLDVAIFTAPKEPLGLRILEPMAIGVPVAAFRTGFGSDELIEDGITGVQVQWARPDSLAARAVELTANPDLWMRISRAAAKAVRDQFSLTVMCERVERVYNDLSEYQSETRAAAG